MESQNYNPPFYPEMETSEMEQTMENVEIGMDEEMKEGTVTGNVVLMDEQVRGEPEEEVNQVVEQVMATILDEVERSEIELEMNSMNEPAVSDPMLLGNIQTVYLDPGNAAMPLMDEMEWEQFKREQEELPVMDLQQVVEHENIFYEGYIIF